MSQGEMVFPKSVVLMLCLLIACGGVEPSGDDLRSVVEEVSRAEEAFAEAERTGNLTAQFEMIAHDYAYIDVSGKRTTKADLMARRAEDKRLAASLVVSEREVTPLNGTTAIARGRWETLSSYYSGLPRRGVDRYMAVWVKREGRWLLLADQVTPVVQREYPVKVRVPLAQEELEVWEGDYITQSETPVLFSLRAAFGHLVLSIPGHLEAMAFFPESERSFFATDRPWTLRFDRDDHPTLVTWGVENQVSRK